MMNRRRHDAVAFCIFLAIIFLSSWAMVNNAQGQGGYPAPTIAYPAPATNTPAPTAAATATPLLVASSTPTCEECQPTSVEIVYASAGPQTPPIMIILVIVLCAAAFAIGLTFGRG